MPIINKNIHRIILYLLFGACFTLPFSYRISTVFLMTFAGLTIVEGIYTKSYTKKKWALQMLGLPSLFFLIVLVGAVFSPYKPEAGKLIIRFLPYLIMSLAYVFSSKTIKEKAPQYIIPALVLGTLLTLFYLFGHAILKFVDSGENSWTRIFSQGYTYNRFMTPLDSHPSYFAIFIILSNFFIFNCKTIRNELKTILLAINFLGLVFVMSRIGLIIYLIQILSLLFFLKGKWRMIYGAVILGGIALGTYLYNTNLKDFYVLQRLSLEFAWDINPENINSTINNRIEDDSRIARWSAIVDAIKEKPILGYGTGSEKSVLSETYKNAGLMISYERKYNTHNQFLFFLLENGIIGFLFFVSFFLTSAKTAFKRSDIFSFLFLFVLLLICMFENYLYRTMGILTISIFLTFMRKQKDE